jgi:hypothetical protein
MSALKKSGIRRLATSSAATPFQKTQIGNNKRVTADRRTESEKIARLPLFILYLFILCRK